MSGHGGPHGVYQPIPDAETEDGFDDHHETQHAANEVLTHQRTRLVIICGAVSLLIMGLAYASWVRSGAHRQQSNCDDVQSGYHCKPSISRFWGQYSPYFSVPSEICADTPPGCKYTFVQVLARHGARDPTDTKTIQYNSLIQKIHSQVHEYSDDYAFLETYVYDLGADQLTTFGGQELVNLGTSFYNRYQNLARKSTPFVRASGQERVVQSAQKFTQGFHGALVKDGMSSNQDHYPYSITTINEGEGNNNTLSHGSCTKFEAGHGHDIGWEAQKQWLQIFATPITARLNKELSGANLTAAETIHFMDLCPFETVASPTGQISPFCNLFSEEEWRQYDYYQSLGKFYGYGSGNPLGPTQGVGFANELIARMTNKPVEDHTSVNHSMDHSDATFPLGRTIYADFTHDNDLTTIYGALGLYNQTELLSNTSIQSTRETDGYSASWTVPFAARAYFERMECAGAEEELVRVLINDRVRPLATCNADAEGRCTLSNFIGSLGFASNGGNWNQCFN